MAVRHPYLSDGCILHLLDEPQPLYRRAWFQDGSWQLQGNPAFRTWQGHRSHQMQLGNQRMRHRLGDI